ncbi:4Fe-4S binding protein [Methanothermobacter wolfeii]|uniref:4Fe-4S binding protein n=1 Tax=Methanothermobacter wolfeii TaxID=145261 RepID=A0ABU8TWJ9_METWO|nr:4Fe-4S binding protein [Methanothermobacter wolfeii]
MCKGCNICVEFCPHEVYEQSEKAKRNAENVFYALYYVQKKL